MSCSFCALWHSTGWDIFDSLAALRLCRLMAWPCARSINCIAGYMAHYAESICSDGGHQQTCYLGVLKNATTCCRSREKGGRGVLMNASLSLPRLPLGQLNAHEKRATMRFLAAAMHRLLDCETLGFCRNIILQHTPLAHEYAGGADEHSASFHFAFSKLHLNQPNNCARQPHT